MADVIVLDGSSSDSSSSSRSRNRGSGGRGCRVPSSPAPRVRAPLSGSSVYADAVKNALAMVSGLINDESTEVTSVTGAKPAARKSAQKRRRSKQTAKERTSLEVELRRHAAGPRLKRVSRKTANNFTTPSRRTTPRPANERGPHVAGSGLEVLSSPSKAAPRTGRHEQRGQLHEATSFKRAKEWLAYLDADSSSSDSGSHRPPVQPRTRTLTSSARKWVAAIDSESDASSSDGRSHRKREQQGQPAGNHAKKASIRYSSQSSSSDTSPRQSAGSRNSRKHCGHHVLKKRRLVRGGEEIRRRRQTHEVQTTATTQLSPVSMRLRMSVSRVKMRESSPPSHHTSTSGGSTNTSPSPRRTASTLRVAKKVAANTTPLSQLHMPPGVNRAAKKICRKSVATSSRPTTRVTSEGTSSSTSSTSSEENVKPRPRPRRQLDSTIALRTGGTDAIALEDIQAQEAEFTRLRAANAMLHGVPQGRRRSLPPSNRKANPATSIRISYKVPRGNSGRHGDAVDLVSSSSDEEKMSVASDGSVSTIEERMMDVNQDRHQSTVPVNQIDTTPAKQDTQQGGTTQEGLDLDMSGFSVESDSLAEMDSAPHIDENQTHKVPFARHCEGFTRTNDLPPNILQHNAPRPFASVLDPPLFMFDPNDELEMKCSFLASFGRLTHMTSSSSLSAYMATGSGNDRESAQEDMNTQVRRIVDTEHPRIQRCYDRRTRAILADSRSRTLAHLLALKARRRALVGSSGECAVNKKISSPVYLMASGDVIVRETNCRSLPSVVLLPKVPPMNSSITCIGARQNIRVDDDPILRYTPSGNAPAIGDPLTTTLGVTHHSDSQRLELSPSALDDEVTEYVLRLVVSQCGDGENVFQALKTTTSLTQPYTDYCTLKKIYDERQTTNRRLADAVSLIAAAKTCPSSSPWRRGALLLTNSRYLREQSEKSLYELLAVPPTNFDAHAVRRYANENPTQQVPHLALRDTNDYCDLVKSYRDQFCRMCYQYDCQQHGQEHPLPARRTDPVYPSIASARLRYETKKEKEICIDGEQECTRVRADQHDTKNYDVQVLETNNDGDQGNSKTVNLLSQQGLRRTMLCQTKKHRAVDATEYVDFSHVDKVSEKMQRLLSSEAPCSATCWKVGTTVTSSDDNTPSIAGFVDNTLGLLVRKFARTLGPNACLLTAMIGVVRCDQVHVFLESLRKLDTQAGNEWHRDPMDMTRRPRKQGRSMASRTSSNRELLKRTRNQRLIDSGANHAYKPCDHEGLCDSTACSCITRDHMCEKACSCTRDCPNRFAGCRCTVGQCQTEACPCFVANRECDPDVCVTCGSCDVALSPFMELQSDRTSVHKTSHGDPDERGLANCANVHTQQRCNKKIHIAKSRIHGWGAFAHHPIKMGEFVYEYTGELITQDETERRGNIYERMSVSYLFDLNEDTVVDAIRVGNKSRFINHATSQANCFGKVVRVGGEHRISLWAMRDIAAGEELFFDYKYRTPSAPEWSRNRQSDLS